jgi:hypothetical protein
MQTFIPRVGRWLLALTAAMLAACTDEPVAPHHRTPSPSAAKLADEFVNVTVTNASGGTEVGSIQWAATQIKSAGGAIHFDPSLDGATITLNGTLGLDHPTYIDGPAKGITLSGNDQYRVISSQSRVSLKNVTVTKGYADYASAIRATSVYLENSTVQDSRSPGSAIRAEYLISLVNSTVSRNTVGGPAVEYRESGWVDIDNSTIAFNAPGAGLGPYGYPTASVRVNLRNSIIANNAQNCSSFFNFVYEGKNISSDWSCGEVGMTVADPELFPLANNGGPTMTHAIPPTSPAFNAGVGCFVNVDQRYVPRDAKCDVGAFEFNDWTKVSITIDPTVRLDAATERALVTGTIKCTRDDVIDLALELHQDQKVGKQVVDVHAAGTTQVACGTTATTWAKKMILTDGTAWRTGAARATANTYDTPEWVTPAGAASAVTISRR